MGRTFEYVFVGIIGLIVLVILLPSLTCACSRNGSNESAAVANLRTINTAQVTYKSMLLSDGTPATGTYGTMDDLIDARVLDDTFAGTKAGYNYSIRVDAAGYTAIALPVSTQTGRYGYYSVPDAVVRYSTDALLAPAGQSGRSVQ